MSLVAANAAAPHALRVASLPGIGDLHRRQPVMTAAGLLLLMSTIPLGLAGLLDERTLNGVAVWSKPLKFAVALGLYTLTLAFFAGWIEPAARKGRLVRYAVVAAVASIAFEQVWISVQAARGVASHFNETTLTDIVAYAMMGVGALILTFAAPVIGWQIHRRPVEGLAPVLKAGAAIGLLLTFPLTVATAGYMSGTGGHWVGGMGSDAQGLFLMGWARDGGDLRVPHFFATHAMHAIPIAAAVSLVVLGRDRVWPVPVFTALYLGFIALVFSQALRGQPFLPFLG